MWEVVEGDAVNSTRASAGGIYRKKMKRVFDFDSITDPLECEQHIAKLKQLKASLINTKRKTEFERLKALNPDFAKEIDSYKASILSGAVACFRVENNDFHVDQVKPKESLRISILTAKGGFTFVVYEKFGVSSKYEFEWKKLERVIDFARFLLANFDFSVLEK